MATNVVMPQMGESVTEGTVTRWIKKVGDAVDRDEPLFEISTDKVDAEIPSPVAGVLLEIKVTEGQTVDVDTVVALIGSAGEQPAASSSTTAQVESAAPDAAIRSGTTTATAANAASAPTAAVAGAVATPAGPPPVLSLEDQTALLRRQKSSPLVRRIAKEHGVDISRLSGSGISGRVTKHDILKVVHGASTSAEPIAVVGHRPSFAPGTDVEVVPMTVMRRRIAEHMLHSRRTSAHVHSVIEIDYTRVANLRAAKKAEYERAGGKLTFLVFIAKAVVGALRKVPVLNASIEGESVVYKRDINLGIAVALDWGLIVPVVKRAHEKSLLTISQEVADLALRSRTKHLKPEDVQGGTFTITNPGGFGTMMGLPIINQPQVGILAVGSIDKRVVVVADDAIAIRQRGLLALGFDHRLVDGAVADAFLAEVKRGLEHFDSSAV
jgi:2-oxoglutarate dehydrogenase E2 component (dihydrolipoamide succinyltransferase)